MYIIFKGEIPEYDPQELNGLTYVIKWILN